MNNHLHINFFARKSTIDATQCSVYVRVTVNGKRETLGTATVVSGMDLPKSVMIATAHWDNARQRVKDASSQAMTLNSAILACEQRLRKLYAQHQGFDKVMTVSGVKSSIRNGGNVRPSMSELMDQFLDERESLGTKASTIETYRFKFRTIRAFLKHESRTEQAAEDFTPGTLKRYKTYMMTQRGNSERSADKSCQVVKTILLWAAGNELISKNPLLNIRVHVDKTPNLECLSQEELAIVRKANLIPALRQVADCLEFACYTGLAYQDMKALTASSVQLVEGHPCIVGNRMKTGTEYYIPISEPLQVLINKYGGISMPLPQLNDYNTMLRQIMLVLGINKHITSHTARKTFADWCINELDMSEEATIVAMGQKAAKELTPYRKTRPKRLLSEFPASLLPSVKTDNESHISANPFLHTYRAS